MWRNSTLLNLLKKYWEKIINYWLRKVYIDTANWEKILDRSTCNVPWLVNFKHVLSDKIISGYWMKFMTINEVTDLKDYLLF